MIVSVFLSSIPAVSLMFSVTPQRDGPDGYVQMMRGSSHMLCRWVSGRLMVRLRGEGNG
jgi:hypothetical protein